MMGPPGLRRLLCLTALQVATSTAQQDGGAFDGSALVQREVFRQRGANSGMVAARPRISAKDLVHKMVASLDKRLDDYEQQHEEDLNHTRAMEVYVEGILQRMNTSFQNKSHDSVASVLADLSDPGDAEVVVKVLSFLRDPEFVKKLNAGLKNMTQSLTTLSLRTEKKVSEVMVAYEESKNFDNMAGFFQKERHIMVSVMESVLATFLGILMAAPGGNAVVADIARPIFAEMVNGTTTALDRRIDAIIASKGAQFCGHMPLQLVSELVAAIGKVKAGAPAVAAFAEANVPDVAKEANKIVQNFLKSMETFLKRAQNDLRLSSEKICGLLGLAVADVLS
mmetsp:Transcript_28545/g.90995  ORF Transcript_28545/g.90995 Transcript_28545/m.90995 type:complete len:338 (+) Transcript_28545:77-1090(+)